MWLKLDIENFWLRWTFQPKTSAKLQQTQYQLLTAVSPFSCILAWVELCGACVLELHYT